MRFRRDATVAAVVMVSLAGLATLVARSDGSRELTAASSGAVKVVSVATNAGARATRFAFTVLSIDQGQAGWFAVVKSSDGISRRIKAGDSLAPDVLVTAIDPAGVTIIDAGRRDYLPLVSEGVAPPDTAYKPADASLDAAPTGVAQAERTGRWPAASAANPVPAP